MPTTATQHDPSTDSAAVADVVDVASLLGSLAEPARLRLLRVLEDHELSVGELALVMQLPQSTLSRHLKALLDAGFITRRAVRTAGYYRLITTDLAPGAHAVWSAVRDRLPEDDLARDHLRVQAVLAERPTDSLGFFGRIAGAWDAVRGNLFGDHFTHPALLTLLRPEWTVADIGCGTGNAAEALAPSVDRVICVDASDEMLDAAGKRLARFENVELRTGPAETLPIDDRSVDAVVMMLLLHHLPDPAAALREAGRVLRTDRMGGAVLVVDMVDHRQDEYRRSMGHHHLGFTPEQITQLFRDAGLPTPRIVPLSPDPQGQGPALFAASAWIETRS